jgi:hypothetical protein
MADYFDVSFSLSREDELGGAAGKMSHASSIMITPLKKS